MTIVFETLEAGAIFHHLRIDEIKKLIASGSCDENIAMLEPACHFFETYYRGRDLQHLRYNRHEFEICRIESYAVPIPVLTFEYWAVLTPSALESVVSLVPSCVPQVLEMVLDTGSPEAFALPECGTIEELRITSSHAHSYIPLNLFQSDDASTPPHPSLRRLVFEVFDFNTEFTDLLKHWISARRPSVAFELVFKDCGICEQDFASLQEVAAVSGISYHHT